jgi:hypothetical protein
MATVKPPAFVVNPIWDKRLDFVKKYFEKESSDSEHIIVEPSDVSSLPLIIVHYETVKNKQFIALKFGLSPALLTILSNDTVNDILMELLHYFRSK